jgi:hypothetical protein
MDLPDSVAAELGSLFRRTVSGLVRTDFSDAEAWAVVAAASKAEVWDYFQNGSSAQASLHIVDDVRFNNFEVADFLALKPRPHKVVYVVDTFALTHNEHPVLAVDMDEKPGSTFRVIPSRIFEVDANVTEGNMYFSEFQAGAGEDLVFRGWS